MCCSVEVLVQQARNAQRVLQSDMIELFARLRDPAIGIDFAQIKQRSAGRPTIRWNLHPDLADFSRTEEAKRKLSVEDKVRLTGFLVDVHFNFLQLNTTHDFVLGDLASSGTSFGVHLDEFMQTNTESPDLSQRHRQLHSYFLQTLFAPPRNSTTAKRARIREDRRYAGTDWDARQWAFWGGVREYYDQELSRAERYRLAKSASGATPSKNSPAEQFVQDIDRNYHFWSKIFWPFISTVAENVRVALPSPSEQLHPAVLRPSQRDLSGGVWSELIDTLQGMPFPEDTDMKTAARPLGDPALPFQLFPQPNFFGGTNRDFIHKEENGAGRWGVETRYPLLDPQVIQEHLWLAARVKNHEFRHCFAEGFRNGGERVLGVSSLQKSDRKRRRPYPFIFGKNGFGAHRTYEPASAGGKSLYDKSMPMAQMCRGDARTSANCYFYGEAREERSEERSLGAAEVRR